MRPPLPSGVAEGAWTPAGDAAPKLFFAPAVTTKLIALSIVITEQKLPAAHVAKEKQYMSITDGPKIGTRAIIADQREHIIFNEGVQVDPVCEVC